MKLSRRLFLAVSALAGLVPVRVVARAFAGSGTSVDPAVKATWAAFVDTLIPQDEFSPGATQLGVDGRMFTDAISHPESRRLLIRVCAWLDAQAEELAGASYVRLDEDRRVAIVERAFELPPQEPLRRFFVTARSDALTEYYSRPEAWRGLGYSGPPQPAGFPDYSEAPPAD